MAERLQVVWNATLGKTLADLNKPDALGQLLVLALCLGLAWWLSRRAIGWIGRDDQGSPVRRLGQGSARRVLFPLMAAGLILPAAAVMAQYIRVGLLHVALSLLGSLALIRIVMYAVRQAFGRTSWLASFDRLLATLVWCVVALHLVGWLPLVIEALKSVSFTLAKQELTLWTVLKALALVLCTLLFALWLAGLAEARLRRASTMDANLQLVLARVVKAALVVVAVLVSLPMVGMDLTTLSVFGGALGVGLGFGLQKIAASYVSGFILLLDRSLRIGNLIAVGNERGVVKEITTRYTVIRQMNGVESIVPNETLVSSVVQNETFSDSQVVVPLLFQVGYGSDLERTMAILVEAARTEPRVLSEPPPRAYVTGFGDNGINLRMGIWIGDPQEGTAAVCSNIYLAVWRRFQQEGIEIPFPQREVRVLGSAGEPGGI